MVRTTFRDELAGPLAAQAMIFAKCWSEWQDLNLRPPRPDRALDRTRYGNSAYARYSSRKAAGTANPAGGLCRVCPGFLPQGVPIGLLREDYPH
jgi:hypothetical protein